jgi:hypothetical protein
MPNSPHVVARMPAFAMFLGVLVIVAGLSWDAKEISTGNILVNAGIALNQLILILATTNLGERNRELKAAVAGQRDMVAEIRAEIVRRDDTPSHGIPTSWPEPPR